MDDLKITPETEARFKERKIKDKDVYEYSFGNYITVLPTHPQEILSEAEAQSNEALIYTIERHANNNDTIVFMRHKDTPDTPFILMEIGGYGVIHCTHICSTSYPDKEVFDFIREYAHQKDLFFDIRMIQMNNALDDEGYKGYIKRITSVSLLSIHAYRMEFIRRKKEELDPPTSET